MIIQDPYYGRKEVSNSDLTELKKYFLPPLQVFDVEQAYRFGNLFDALITEPEKCDHLKKQVDGIQFTDEEWFKAYSMMKSLRSNSAIEIFKNAVGQKTFSNSDFKIQYEDLEFSLPARCKYDAWLDGANWGGDYKTTMATTQRGFEDAFMYLDYDRSRAWYMDISGASRDLVIGISKIFPHKVFKIFITRDSEIYKSGKAKYEELAFRWWTLFAELEMEVAA